jgi:hypothetical protein
MEVNAVELEEAIRFLDSFCLITRDLIIHNLGAISKDSAAEIELSKNEFLNSLTLRWASLIPREHNEIEVLESLQPSPTSSLCT